MVVGDAQGQIEILDLLASNCYTQQTDPNNPARCSCQEGKGWIRGNCTVLECGDGKVDTRTNLSCTCKEHMTWNAILQSCVPNCLPSSYPNANGTLYELTSCFCNPNSDWSYEFVECIPNCSAIFQASGILTRTACNCSEGYLWNVSLTLC